MVVPAPARARAANWAKGSITLDSVDDFGESTKLTDVRRSALATSALMKRSPSLSTTLDDEDADAAKGSNVAVSLVGVELPP